MDSQITQTVSFSEISRLVNNGENSDVIVFNHGAFSDREKKFPIKFDTSVFSVCTRGHSKICIDLKEYEIEPNTIITLQPNNYVTYSEASEDFRCIVVVCSRSIMEEVLPKLSDLLPYMMRRRISPVNKLTDGQIKTLNPYFTIISQTLANPRTPLRRKKLVCLLQALVYEMMEIGRSSEGEDAVAHTRKEETMAKFIIAVSENFRTDRNVASYARRLFITPKHLTYIVKEMSGRTAREWIENFVIIEAKILLRNTDMNIQEIATYLNFPNQSFFGKYFKHLTGQTPTDYRRSQD